MKQNLEELLDQEETLWKQRAKTQWLAEGDRNTRFFHAQASKRSCQNWIDGLRDNMGVLQSDLGIMGGIAIDYFKEIFTSRQPTDREIEVVVETMRSRVDQSIN